MRAPTQLSIRAEQITLPGAGPDDRFRPLLAGEADRDTWRIVELFSVGGGPFEAELAWSSGSGVGAHARLTVAYATRVAVYARSLRVGARNLMPGEHRVGVTVADGVTTTHNQWELRGEATPTPLDLPVPPFARTARLDLADANQLPTTELHLLDPLGTSRAQIFADRQPDDGVRVGGAQHVRILANATVAFRLVFDLTL